MKKTARKDVGARRSTDTAALEEHLRREHAIHVIRCSLPIPGTMNVYFVREPVPTLVDVPAAGGVFVDELDRGLRTAGCSLDDIRRIIVTHPHFDHYGSAREIVERTGAEMWVFREGAHWIEQSEEEHDRQGDQRREFLLQAGAPLSDIELVNGYYREADCFAEGLAPSRRLAAGEALTLGDASFALVPVPGHTPFCVMIYSAERGVAFTGDFLPPLAPGSPLVQWPDLRVRGYRTTSSYVSSLMKVKAMDLRLALPGHGPLIADPSRRIDALLSSIEKRRGEVLRALGKGGKTAFQIAGDVFPAAPPESLFRTVSDIVGQLEMLEDEGIVIRRGTTPVVFTRD